jgi:hypothetical protein
VVHGSGQHARELGPADALLERRKPRLGFGDGPGVVLGRAEFEKDARVVDVARQLLDAVDLLLERRAFAGDGLRLLRVVPEPGDQRLLLESVDLGLEPGQVKDAPLAP